MGIQAATLHLPALSLTVHLCGGKMALGIVSRLYSWVNYKAAGRQAVPLCAREKTEQSNCSWETLWFSSSRHAAGFPPWTSLQLMPLNRRDRSLWGSARTYWDRENQGLSLLRVISLIPSKSLWRRYAVKCIWADSGLPLEHTKVKERKSQADILCSYPQTVTFLLTGHYILGITSGFLLSWLYRC